MNLPLFRRKDRIVFPIVRVDDRLLHGQVIVGWGQGLELAPMILASDRVSKDEALSRTFLELIPQEMDGAVLSLADTVERWLGGALKNRRAMIVVESPVDALKMIRLGAPLRVLVLGGLHYREGREEFLPYVHLSEWDRTTLGELRGLGVRILCQDLPSTRPVTYEG